MEEHFSWWNIPFEFLFGSWNVTTATTLIFTALAVFCIAIAFEGLRVVIVTLHKAFFSLPLVPVSTQVGSDDASSTCSVSESIKVTDSLKYVRNQRIKNHCLQTIVHVTKVMFSYGLMLAAMTYNGYIVIALLAGATIGYFVFCYKINAIDASPHPVTISRTTTVTTCNFNSNDPSLKSLTEDFNAA